MRAGPEKNPKNIFISTRSGGKFEQITNSSFTAERLAFAHEVVQAIDSFKQQVKGLKVESAKTRNTELTNILGARILVRWDDFVLMLPQASLFIATLVGHQIGSLEASKVPRALIAKCICKAAWKTFQLGEQTEGTWPTLLKSQTFIDSVKKVVPVAKH